MAPKLAVFCFLACMLSEGGTGGHAQYVGGTISKIPDGCSGTVAAVDEQYMVFYSKKASSVALQFEFFSRRGLAPEEEMVPLPRHQLVGVLDVQREADRVVLEEYGPPGVVVNEDLEIVHFRGHASPYFDPMPGPATLNLLKVADQ